MYEKLQQTRAANTKKKIASPHLLITVNPTDDVDMEQFYKKVSKMQRKKTTKALSYAFEQRGEDDEEMGQGAHVHMFYTHHMNNSLAEIRRNVENTFKDIVDITPSNRYNVINIRAIKEGTEARALAYLTGVKADEDKSDKCEMDNAWRNTLPFPAVEVSPEHEVFLVRDTSSPEPSSYTPSEVESEDEIEEVEKTAPPPVRELDMYQNFLRVLRIKKAIKEAREKRNNK
jgi:hypothetical protein